MTVRKNQGSGKPSLISYERRLGMRRYTIRFDVEEVTTDSDGESESATTQYQWTELDLPIGNPTYASLVSGLIRGRYTDDEMTAIVNNHLLDDGDDEHEAEWQAMQEWRAEAKVMAREILEEITAGTAAG